MSEKLIVYGTPVCPMVPPVRGLLSAAQVEYVYVDISQDNAARERVREINAGNESVPTLEFPDGSTLTEPSTSELTARLKTLGYAVPLHAQLMGRLPLLIIGAVVLWGMLRFLGLL